MITSKKIKNNLIANTAIMGSLSCCVTSFWMERRMASLADCYDTTIMSQSSQRSLLKCTTRRQKALVGHEVSNRKSVMTWHDSLSRCSTTFNTTNNCYTHVDNKTSNPTFSDTVEAAGIFSRSSAIHNITESLIHWLPIVCIIWMIFKAIYDDKSALDDDKSKHRQKS